jgi:hypothetical protein
MMYAAIAVVVTIVVTACSGASKGDGNEINVSPFPLFSAVDGGAESGDVVGKSSWEDGDKIYLQINGEKTWHTLTYVGAESKWTSGDLPKVWSSDNYRAVYAPAYEVGADGALVLQKGKSALSSEYMTYEGSRPISITFSRGYSRIRIYCGEWPSVKFNVGGITCSNKSTVNYGLYTLTPDKSGNAYIYCSWNSTSCPLLIFETPVKDVTFSTYLYVGMPYMPVVTASSVSNKSYDVDCSCVTLDLDKLGDVFTAPADWTAYTKAGYSRIKVTGRWDKDNHPRFSGYDSDSYVSGNQNIVSVDLSGVRGVSRLDDYAFRFCRSLKSVALPLCMEGLDVGLFEDCVSLESVEIPEKVTFVETLAFSNCAKLQTVVCRPTTPPQLGAQAFQDTPSDKVLYVPASAVEAYKTSSWNNYFSEIRAIEE